MGYFLYIMLPSLAALALFAGLVCTGIVIGRSVKNMNRDAAIHRRNADVRHFGALFVELGNAEARDDPAAKMRASEGLLKLVRNADSTTAKQLMTATVQLAIMGKISMGDLVECRQEEAVRACAEENHVLWWDAAKGLHSLRATDRIFTLLAFWLKLRPYGLLDSPLSNDEGQKVISHFHILFPPPKKSDADPATKTP